MIYIVVDSVDSRRTGVNPSIHLPHDRAPAAIVWAAARETRTCFLAYYFMPDGICDSPSVVRRDRLIDEGHLARLARFSHRRIARMSVDVLSTYRFDCRLVVSVGLLSWSLHAMPLHGEARRAHLEGANSMRVSFNKASIAAAASLAALVLTNAALAVSLGYPQGRPYFGSNSGQSTARSYSSSAPSYAASSDETRQSFSYEPSEGGSLRATTSYGGCCCGGQVARSSESTDDVASNQGETRRSFSYEPEAQSYSADSAMSAPRYSAPHGDSWLMQKANPRRYSW